MKPTRESLEKGPTSYISPSILSAAHMLSITIAAFCDSPTITHRPPSLLIQAMSFLPAVVGFSFAWFTILVAHSPLIHKVTLALTPTSPISEAETLPEPFSTGLPGAEHGPATSPKSSHVPAVSGVVLGHGGEVWIPDVHLQRSCLDDHQGAEAAEVWGHMLQELDNQLGGLSPSDFFAVDISFSRGESPNSTPYGHKVPMYTQLRR